MSATHPDHAAGRDGSLVRAEAEYLVGTSGDQRIRIEYRSQGDASWSSPVYAVDQFGAELHCVDGGFGNLQHAAAGHAPWTLAIIYTGETAISTWFSTHEGEWSFTRA